MRKSATQPRCYWCDKPIKKWTEWHNRRNHGDKRDAPLYSKADCQRLTNGTVVSIRYEDPRRVWNEETGDYDPAPTGEKRLASAFYSWDGESYSDDLFCTREHAELLGRAIARRAATASRIKSP